MVEIAVLEQKLEVIVNKCDEADKRGDFENWISNYHACSALRELIDEVKMGRDY